MSTNSAAVSASVEDVQGDNRWRSQHERQVTDCQLKKPDVLFVGDSLIHRMRDTEAWENYFQPLHSVNAGIGGDSTQHVLWRLENGLLSNCSPKVLVVLVGTNNHGHTADQVSEALEAIAWSVYNQSPQTKTVILGLFPRGEKANPIREKIYQINYNMERIITTVPNAYFLIADPGFVRHDDTIAPEDMLDYLHLTRRGYNRTCPIIARFVKKLLADMTGAC
ncbi:platelet-activating factor acetylhydrolase IB subunit alpha1-like [Hydractinia symbiolongicarpus]|uniref:platelet-activating factor acetylhydrolase IB subunit alpha1-like n=1 Tax=Hydractinia symbiolongicarpus TaxID=13093 RepID=UPI002550988E|nr:platelet-activating factor acetylhydrolase IB subunit alpha1-like [Hydractinia symbiolongicarpus]